MYLFKTPCCPWNPLKISSEILSGIPPEVSLGTSAKVSKEDRQKINVENGPRASTEFLSIFFLRFLGHSVGNFFQNWYISSCFHSVKFFFNISDGIPLYMYIVKFFPGAILWDFFKNSSRNFFRGLSRNSFECFFRRLFYKDSTDILSKKNLGN